MLLGIVCCLHNGDVIMRFMASQIISLTIVYPSFIHVLIKENIKTPHLWPLCWELTGDRWIPRTKGQLRGNCFHLMTCDACWHSSCLSSNFVIILPDITFLVAAYFVELWYNHTLSISIIRIAEKWYIMAPYKYIPISVLRHPLSLSW